MFFSGSVSGDDLSSHLASQDGPPGTTKDSDSSPSVQGMLLSKISMFPSLLYSITTLIVSTRAHKGTSARLCPYALLVSKGENIEKSLYCQDYVVQSPILSCYTFTA